MNILCIFSASFMLEPLGILPWKDRVLCAGGSVL